MRIALFITCVADTLFPETGRSVVRVLERLGHEVVFPAEQTCCGQMHVNTGYRDDALRLARRFVDIFARDDGVDAVVSPSSSCVGWVRVLLPEVAREAGDEQLARDAEALGGRFFELSEFLVRRLGVEDVGATFPRRVTLHPTCHSQRVTRVGDAPQRLLAHVRGPRAAGAAGGRRVLRLRRHVLDQERRCLPGDAGRQVRQHRRHRRGRGDRRRPVVPAAHRRRTEPDGRRREGRPPGRHPGVRAPGRTGSPAAGESRP